MGIAICKFDTDQFYIFLANHCILNIGGDRFDLRADQEALLDVLVRTENDHARRTTAVQNQMREAWGWMSED